MVGRYEKMGEVARSGPLKVIVNTNDHPPPHAHVVKGRGRGEIVIRISLEDLMPMSIEGRGADRVVQDAQKLVLRNFAACRDKWNEYHG